MMLPLEFVILSPTIPTPAEHTPGYAIIVVPEPGS